MSTSSGSSEPAAESVGVVNQSRFNEDTLDLLEILGLLATAKFGQRVVEYGEGSISLKIDEKVVGKILPQEPGPDEHLLIGVSAVLEPMSWDPKYRPFFVGPKLLRGQPFYWTKLPKKVVQAVRQAASLFNTIAEKTGS